MGRQAQMGYRKKVLIGNKGRQVTTAMWKGGSSCCDMMKKRRCMALSKACWRNSCRPDHSCFKKAMKAKHTRVRVLTSWPILRTGGIIGGKSPAALALFREGEPLKREGSFCSTRDFPRSRWGVHRLGFDPRTLSGYPPNALLLGEFTHPLILASHWYCQAAS